MIIINVDIILCRQSEGNEPKRVEVCGQWASNNITGPQIYACCG